jgi:hypothetical protein
VCEHSKLAKTVSPEEAVAVGTAAALVAAHTAGIEHMDQLVAEATAASRDTN